MKKNVILLLAVAGMLAACKPQEPQRENRGRIVGTFQSYDAERVNILNGYYIEINGSNEGIRYDETMLSFNLDVKDSIHMEWGSRVISPIALPYDFTYKIVRAGDEGFVNFDIPLQTALGWQPFPPLDTIPQVLIYPK